MEAPKEEWSLEWEQMEKRCIFLVTHAKGEHSFPSNLFVSSAISISHTYIQNEFGYCRLERWKEVQYSARTLARLSWFFMASLHSHWLHMGHISWTAF